MTSEISKKLTISIITALTLGFWSIAVFAAEAPPEIKIGSQTPPEIKINITSGSGQNPSGQNPSGQNPSGYPTDTSTTIKITKHDVAPKGFNPAVDTAKITFGISKDAVVEIKILDSNDQVVKEIMKNQSLAAGNDYYQTWYGTDDNGYDSKIVSNGTYKYQIIAKNPTTQEIEDTKDGEINVVYAETKTGVDTTVAGEQATQDKATSVLQNDFKGKTSKTGPESMIYLLFPLGYFIYLKRK